MKAPSHLRIEHLERPMGIDRAGSPAVLAAAGGHAGAAGVPGRDRRHPQAAAWTLPPRYWCRGPAIRCGRGSAVAWRVKVWTDLGESDWSAPSTFEAGLARADRLDGPVDRAVRRAAGAARRTSGVRAATRVRGRRGRLGPPLRDRHTASTRCSSTAHRVGDVELAPGFTAYDRNLHVQTYDVTDLLRPGTNTWEVVLSDGWYRGRTGFLQIADNYGDTRRVPRSAARRRPGLRHRRGLAVVHRADHRRRPHGRAVRRPAAAAGASGTRSGSSTTTSARLTVVAGAADPPGRGAAARSAVTRLGARPPRRRPRPEHQRLGPPAATSARRARPSRSPTARRSTPRAT